MSVQKDKTSENDVAIMLEIGLKVELYANKLATYTAITALDNKKVIVDGFTPFVALTMLADKVCAEIDSYQKEGK